MKICLYGINFSPERIGIGKYSGEIVDFLIGQGHQVRVITAPPYYPDWEIQPPYKAWKYHTEVLGASKIYRIPLWVPKNPTLFSRLLHLVSFSLLSIPALIKVAFWRADIIITVVPTNFGAPLSLLTGKLSGANSWLHIQDFEIDAMFELGMASKLNILKKVALKLESFLLKRFDIVSSISRMMTDIAIEKGVRQEQVKLLPNWVKLDSMQYDSGNEFRKQHNISDDTCLILYSGNLGNKQGLHFIPKVANILGHQNEKKILFVIVGEGTYKAELQLQVRELHLENILFLPLQPLSVLPNMLSTADIHLVLQRRGAADNVLPSKLTNILAVGGNALITAEKNTELGQLITHNPGIAELVPPEDFLAFSEKLKELIFIKKQNKPNSIALEYAKENLDAQTIWLNFEKNLRDTLD